MRNAIATASSDAASRRPEALAAAAETLGLFLIFIVAFTGRDRFGDTVKLALILLTFVVGGLGIAAGIAIGRRALTTTTGRIARLALAAYMIGIGAYSIIHVAS